MASDNETLWVVIRANVGDRYWIFRTRAAAGNFVREKGKRTDTAYIISRATWGPES